MNEFMVMLPYKETSKGSKMMANALRISRVPREQHFNPDYPIVALNWGRGDYPQWREQALRWINPPEAVMKAIDKFKAFAAFRRAGVPCAPFTTSREEAQRWLDNGHRVFARTELQGKDADGIVVVEQGNHLPLAPLYTKYVRKEVEFRVHVMGGECFYANQKKRKAAERVPKGASPYIRSGSHGWFFAHMDDLPSKAVQEACIGAVEALGLDFGGVDVGVSQNGEPTIYEVNTAPEMGENTTAAYLRAFKKHYGQYKNNENVPIRNL